MYVNLVHSVFRLNVPQAMSIGLALEKQNRDLNSGADTLQTVPVGISLLKRKRT